MKRRILLLCDPKTTVAAHLCSRLSSFGCEVQIVSRVPIGEHPDSLSAAFTDLDGAIIHIDAPVAAAQLAWVRHLRHVLGGHLPVIALVREQATRGCLLQELMLSGVTRYITVYGHQLEAIAQLLVRELLAQESQS